MIAMRFLRAPTCSAVGSGGATCTPVCQPIWRSRWIAAAGSATRIGLKPPDRGGLMHADDNRRSTPPWLGNGVTSPGATV